MSSSRMAAVRFNNEASRFLTAAKTGDAHTVLSMLKYGPITNANMRTRGRGVDGVVSGSHTQKEYFYEEMEVDVALPEFTSEAKENSDKGGSTELDVCARTKSSTRRVCREREVTVLYDDDIGFTPLMLAAKYGHVEVVTALLMRNNDVQIEHDEKMNADWLRWWQETRGRKQGSRAAQKQNDHQAPPPHAYKPMHPNVAAMKFVDVNATAANVVPSAFQIKEAPKSRYYCAGEAETTSFSLAGDAASSLDPTRGEDFFLTPLALAVRYHRPTVVAALLKLCCGLNTDADAVLSSSPAQQNALGLYDFKFTLPPPPLPLPSSPSAVQSDETETNANTKSTITDACDCGALPSVHQMLSLPLVVLPLGPLDMGNISTGGVDAICDSIVNFAIRAGVKERETREAEAERQGGAFRPALSALFSSTFFLEDDKVLLAPSTAVGDDGNNTQIDHGEGAYPPRPPPSIGVPNELLASVDTADRCFFGNSERFNFDETEIVRLLSQAIAVGIRNRFVRDSLKMEDPNIWPLCDVILVADSLSRLPVGRPREDSRGGGLGESTHVIPSFYYPPAAAYTNEMLNPKKEANSGNNSTSNRNGERWCVWHPLPLTPFYAETAGRGRRNGHLQRLSGLAYNGAAPNAVADLLSRKKTDGASIGNGGGTPLHLAVALESAPLVKLLLSLALDDVELEIEEKGMIGFEKRWVSNTTDSRSDDEEEEEEEDTFTASNRFLLCDPFAVDEEEETAFHRACSRNSVSIIKVFLAFSQQMRRWVDEEEAFFLVGSEQSNEKEKCEEDEDRDDRRKGNAPSQCPPHLTNIVFIAGGGTIRTNIISQRSPLVGRTALHFAASASRGARFGLRSLCALVDSEMALARMRVPPLTDTGSCISTTDTYTNTKRAYQSVTPPQNESGDAFAPAAPFFKELLDAFEGRNDKKQHPTASSSSSEALGGASSLDSHTCVVKMGSSSTNEEQRCTGSAKRTFSFLPSNAMVADGFPLVFSAMVSYLLWAFGRSAEGKETILASRSILTFSSSCAKEKILKDARCFEDSLASGPRFFKFHERGSRSRDSLWWCPDNEVETEDGVMGCAINDELRQLHLLLLPRVSATEFEEGIKKRPKSLKEECQQPSQGPQQQQLSRGSLMESAFRVVASQVTFTGTTVLTSVCAAFETPPFWSLDVHDLMFCSSKSSERNNNVSEIISAPASLGSPYQQKHSKSSPSPSSDGHESGSTSEVRSTPALEKKMNLFLSNNQLLQQIAFGLTCGTFTQRAGIKDGLDEVSAKLPSSSPPSLDRGDDNSIWKYSFTDFPAPTCLFTAGPADSRIVRSLALLSEMLRSLGPNAPNTATTCRSRYIPRTEHIHVTTRDCRIDNDHTENQKIESATSHPIKDTSDDTFGDSGNRIRTDDEALYCALHWPGVFAPTREERSDAGSARRVRAIGGGDATALDMEGETPLMLLLSSVGNAMRGGNAGPPWTAPSEVDAPEEGEESQIEFDLRALEEAEATRTAVNASRSLRQRGFECFPAVYAAEMLLVAGDTQLSAASREKGKKTTPTPTPTRHYVDLVSERHEWTPLHYFVRGGLDNVYSSADLGDRIKSAVSYLNEKTEEEERHAAQAGGGGNPLQEGEVNFLVGESREGGIRESGGDNEEAVAEHQCGPLSVASERGNEEGISHENRKKTVYTYATAAMEGVFDGYLVHIISSFLTCEHHAMPFQATIIATKKSNDFAANNTQESNGSGNMKIFTDKNPCDTAQKGDVLTPPTLASCDDGRRLLRACCLPTAASLPDVELYRIQYAVSLCELLLHRHSAAVTPSPASNDHKSDVNSGDSSSSSVACCVADEAPYMDTALHLIARASESIPSLLVAKALFDVGVDVNALDEEGCTALDLAIESENHLFARLLVSEGGERRMGNLT